MARHQLAVIALVAIALASSFSAAMDVFSTFNVRGLFGVAAFEARFDSLRLDMRPNVIYGYVSDNPIAEPAAQAEYFLTQYTLVPSIIKLTSEEKLNIGNMHNQPQDQLRVDADLAARHLVTVRDYGNGVRIFRNNEAK